MFNFSSRSLKPAYRGQGGSSGISALASDVLEVAQIAPPRAVESREWTRGSQPMLMA